MIAKFDEINDYRNIGNKAKFLIQMRKNNFNVPDGLVIDSNTYKEILKENKIDIKIDDFLKETSLENVSKISEQIIKLFNNIKVNDNIRNEINNKISKNKKYAVRSSGMQEDLEKYSFAGQYQTYLNVNYNDIVKKVIECYKSMFSTNILTYLLNNNLNFKNLEMSVIVQEMIDSEYSGICFTINPISGNDKEMLIEVSRGLGENIVGGKSLPEQYYYNWYDKKFKYSDSNKLLNNSILENISKTFLNIQLFFGYPCDIEFSIHNNKLYILQARKITKIKYQGIEDMWSTADFKDGGVSASICKPYMWSLYEYIWEYTLKKFIIDSKILKEKEINRKLGNMFYARCYWNMSIVKKAMSKVVGYKEREFDSEYGIKIDYEGDGETTKISLKSLLDIIKMALAQNKILKVRNENAEKYKEELLNKYLNYKNIYEKNSYDVKNTWYNLTKNDYLQSESTYFWQIFINTVHQALYKDSLLKYVSESQYLTLLGNIENISHLLPFYDMWNISRDIRNNKKEFEYWTKNSVQTICDFIQKSKDEKINKLIENYGYHSDKELDVTYRCYYEDIEPLISSIKSMVLLEDKFSPKEDQKEGKQKYEEILNLIEKQVNKSKFKKIKNKIEKMRKMLWWREEFRDISTRFYYIIRIYTLKLAETLVEEKVINKVDDIWFLKVSNIWDYIDNKLTSKDLNAIIEQNKIYYYSYKNYMSENEIGAIFNNSEKKINTKLTQIKGLGANNGTVIGTARVIENFEEIDKIQKDDILVTKFTDTGWTPKFAILSGIVTEYGGILCHAAIVSREYGIPAIVSCQNIMEKIQDGQKIKIDGTTGIVTILGD